MTARSKRSACKNCGEPITRTWGWNRIWYHVDGSNTVCGPRVKKAEPMETTANCCDEAIA